MVYFVPEIGIRVFIFSTKVGQAGRQCERGSLVDLIDMTHIFTYRVVIERKWSLTDERERRLNERRQIDD